MIDRARDLLREARRIVSFSGAGLSAESGIPTFRDAATKGFWIDYDPQKLASPDGFRDDPQLVYRWYSDRRRDIAAAQPNPAHRTLAAHSNIVNVTQNIDDLLHRAGAVNVIQLHGTITQDRCNRPDCRYTETVDLADPPELRACPECGDSLRPTVVWFGEMLPDRAWQDAESACAECDALLVIGTSAEVYPAAGLIGVAKAAGATIIIVNTHASDASHLADIELIGPAGELLPQILES